MTTIEQLSPLQDQELAPTNHPVAHLTDQEILENNIFLLDTEINQLPKEQRAKAAYYLTDVLHVMSGVVHGQSPTPQQHYDARVYTLRWYGNQTPYEQNN